MLDEPHLLENYLVLDEFYWASRLLSGFGVEDTGTCLAAVLSDNRPIKGCIKLLLFFNLMFLIIASLEIFKKPVKHGHVSEHLLRGRRVLEFFLGKNKYEK